MEVPHGGRNAKNFKVIFILEDRKDTFSPPNVDNSIGNHAGITAGTSSAKRVCMINKELTGKALNN